MKPTIALYVQHPYASSQCANGVIKALENDFRFKIFTKHEQMDGFFEDVDMICFPGGTGDSVKFKSIHQSTIDMVKSKVASGVPYLGICMGAYWTGHYYMNIMGDTLVEQYITQPHADTRRPHAKSISITWNDDKDKMFFYDGCAIIGDETKFKTIARYANGNPMAIIKNNIGLIGCHPEAEKDWYDCYSWMKKHWNGSQSDKLLQFVNKLI